MLFWNRKKEVPVTPKPKHIMSETELLAKAYHIGKFSPSNCECPPAPDIIPVWVNNNVEAFEISLDRFFSEVEVPAVALPEIYRSVFEGFRDLIRSCPDEGDSPFCLSQEEVISISKAIFVTLARKQGVALDL